MTFPSERVARLLCAEAGDDWRDGKAYWLRLSDHIAAIAMETREGGDAQQAPSRSDDSAAIAPIVPQSLSKED